MKRAALYLFLALAAATFVYPFVWMLAATFKPPLEAGTLSIVSPSTSPTEKARTPFQSPSACTTPRTPMLELHARNRPSCQPLPGWAARRIHPAQTSTGRKPRMNVPG